MMNFLLKTKIAKLAKEHVRVKTFREYARISQITVLFEIEDFDKVVDFVDILEQDGKKVLAYSFDSKNLLFNDLPENYRIWNKSKMDFWGFPNDVDFKEFKSLKSDTLIDLTGNTLPLYKYLFLNSAATFRVGFEHDDASFYDLLIERNPEHDFSFFAEQLLFYMKSLRSK